MSAETSKSAGKFRILSIDGGGIKGVFPASFLAEVEDAFAIESVAPYFDLIAGTSTGGIIALALGFGWNARRLRDLYLRLGPVIFPAHPVAGWMRHWFAPKYSPEPLRAACEEVFGDHTLGQSTNRLLIPSLSSATAEIHIFKTRHHQKLDTDFRVPALDVALATSAAPSYFPLHKSGLNIKFVDGGIWANNPTGLAAVEAVTMLRQAPADVRILSLGCSAEPVSLDGRFMGKLGWAARAIEAALSGQSGGSLGAAAMIVGKENLFRYNPVVAKGRYSLDRTDNVEELCGLGYTEARKALPALKSTFFGTPAEPFVPVP